MSDETQFLSRRLPLEDIITQKGANCFLLGLCFNQTIKAEQAWQAPKRLMDRLGTTDVTVIAKMNYNDVEKVIAQSPALHPFSGNMAKYVINSCNLLTEKYEGDARNIWCKGEDCQELIKRLTEFSGVGKHKAVVAIFLLTVEFGVAVYEDGSNLNLASECSALANLYAPISNPQLMMR